MSRRISFTVETEELHEALKKYANTRGLRLGDFAQVAMYTYIRRSPTKNAELMDILKQVL